MLKQRNPGNVLDQTEQNHQQTQSRYGLDVGFKSLGQTGSYKKGGKLANFNLTGSLKPGPYSRFFLSVLV